MKNTQPFNFRWRGIEISWYKWFGRGTSSNIEITPNMASEMLRIVLVGYPRIRKIKGRRLSLGNDQPRGNIGNLRSSLNKSRGIDITMARQGRKRKTPVTLPTVHDRRSTDAPGSATVAPIESR